MTKVAVEEDSGSGNIIDVNLVAVCGQHLEPHAEYFGGRWFIMCPLSNHRVFALRLGTG